MIKRSHRRVPNRGHRAHSERNEDNLTKYFLTELKLLENRAMRFEENKASRINFFIILFGILIAAVASASQASVVQQKIRLIFCLLSVIMLIIGILSLENQVSYSITITTLYRRSGRIRRWFLDHNKGIAPYLIFEPADDKPAFIRKNMGLFWRGAEPTLIILNSFFFSSFIALTLTFSMFADNLVLSVAIALVSFLAFYVIQVLWIKIFLNKFQAKKDKQKKEIRGIIFPYVEKEIKNYIADALNNER